jgi:hypothetical protein
MDIKLKVIHAYLMNHGFPYHSVSVLKDDHIGYHVLFMNDVCDKVTDEVKRELELYGFKFAFVG